MRYVPRARAVSSTTANAFSRKNEAYTRTYGHGSVQHRHSQNDASCSQGNLLSLALSTPIYHLPQTAIQLIAAHLHPDSDDLLHFAQADASFVEGVAYAYDYTFRVDRISQHSALFQLLVPHLRTVRYVIDDRFGAAASLMAGYNALVHGFNLRSVEMVASKPGLDALCRNASVRDVHLHVFKANIHGHVLHTLNAMHALEGLRLTCYKDKDKTLARDTAREFRCGCRYFRGDLSVLVRACPNITAFALACECAANRTLTVPPFPLLRDLAARGRLDMLVPGHEDGHGIDRGKLATLESLTLENPSDVAGAIQALVPHVTGLELPWTRVLNNNALEVLLACCPRLKRLDAVVTAGCEDIFTRYLPSLRHVTFLRLKVINRKELATRRLFFEGYYKPRLGALTKTVRAMEALEELHLTDVCVHPVEFDDMMAHAGGTLRKLSIPLKSPDSNVDTIDVLDVFLGCILRHCTKVRRVIVSRPGSINVLSRQRQRRGVPIIINRDEILIHVEGLIMKLERKLPGICVASVKKLIDPKYGRPKRQVTNAFDLSDSDASEAE